MMINENNIEQECINWFADLGYNINDANYSTINNPVNIDKVKQKICDLNPNINKQEVNEVIQKINDLSEDLNLFSRNRSAYKMITTGVKINRVINDEQKTEIIKLIDLDDPQNNDFEVASQLSFQGKFEKRRPDLIVYINGFPVSVIELKNPIDEFATLEKAYNQIQTYQSQFDNLFTFNVCNVLSDGTYTGVGSLTASFSRYNAWRKNEKNTQNDWQLLTLVNGLFRKDLLIDYLRYFVFFEEETPGKIIKKIAGYHQFYGVRKAVNQSLKSHMEKTGKGGVFWHTQGSGKSISMVFYVAKLRQQLQMNNPTFVVVTDRQDLDRQLFLTFKSAINFIGHVEQADSRKSLREFLNARISGGLLFTTIQKFALEQGEEKFPELNSRENIVVIADEAHRSHYGHIKKFKCDKGTYEYGSSQHMRDAMPNASFIGFTGTPIDIEDRSTKSVFGDYVDIYDINDAVQDKSTVELYYESRIVKMNLSGDLEQINDLVEEAYCDEESKHREKAKSQWSSVASVAGANDRVEKIANDITRHFSERQTELLGKAMIVAMTRENCVGLYNQLVKINPDWHNQDPNKGKIKVVMTSSADDSDILKDHKYTKRSLETIETRFKDPDDELKIVIVCDMWLTGFDVPCANTLYVDKPMQGHNLMQAIARVNRIFIDKPSGLIVDYIGIAPKLQQATKTYTNANGKGRPTIDVEEAINICIDLIDVCREKLKNVEYSKFAKEPLKIIPKVVDYLLDPSRQKDKKTFCDKVSALTKAYTLCGTDKRIDEYSTEIAFYRAIKIALTKGNKSNTLNNFEKEQIMRRLVGDAVTVKEDILSINNLSGINYDEKISILDKKFLKQVTDLLEKNIALEVLKKALENEIKYKFKNDIIMENKFSELLIKTIQKMNQQTITTAQGLKEIIKIAEEIEEEQKTRKDLKLSPEEMAFYHAICQNKSAVENMEIDILVELAQKIRSKLAELVTVDWTRRDNVLASIRIKIKQLLRKYKYPPDKQQEAVDLVLKQAMVVGKGWEV